MEPIAEKKSDHVVKELDQWNPYNEQQKMQDVFKSQPQEDAEMMPQPQEDDVAEVISPGKMKHSPPRGRGLENSPPRGSGLQHSPPAGSGL
mmetsp:Transcript_34357/g.52647  ORF Transcript_34357/g.52647 Transcript_34357/m.52647 type:complete len:91 (-) Transcript_34357:2123-2395(-)